MQTYEVTNSNPYNIKKVFTQASKAQENTLQNDTKNSLNSLESTHTIHIPPHIDYIIFLDSDDYLHLTCIQSCLETNADNKAQLIYYDDTLVFEDIEKPTQPDCTWQEAWGITKATFLTTSVWLEKTIQRKANYFGVTRGVVIDFNFLQSIKLRFLNGIYHEDILFGVLLFMQAKNILILPEKYYYYRLRAGSTCNHNNAVVKIPPYLERFLPYFNSNTKLVSKYNFASSWALITLHTLEFLQNFENKELVQSFEQAFMPYYAKQFLLLFDCKADPLNLRPKLSILLPYLKNTRLSFYQKVLVFCPLLRPITSRIHRFYLWQKDLEREFRRWRKGRKARLGKAAK